MKINKKTVFRNNRDQQFYMGVGVAKDFNNPEISLAVFRPRGNHHLSFFTPMSEFERNFTPVKVRFERRR